MEGQVILRLWTVQEIPFWNRLKSGRRLRANRQIVKRGTGGCLEAIPAYDWLATRMDAMIGGRPTPMALPLWAWQQWDGAAQARPDLRSVGHFPRGTRGVRIEMEIDDGAVVLSDFDLWHFVMNGHYIADSEKDDDAFYAKVPKKWHAGCWNKASMPLRHRRRIEASWEKIFDLDRTWDEDWHGPCGREKQTIQATVWSIDIGMVRRVTEFTAR